MGQSNRVISAMAISRRPSSASHDRMLCAATFVKHSMQGYHASFRNAQPDAVGSILRLPTCSGLYWALSNSRYLTVSPYSVDDNSNMAHFKTDSELMTNLVPASAVPAGHKFVTVLDENDQVIVISLSNDRAPKLQASVSGCDPGLSFPC